MSTFIFFWKFWLNCHDSRFDTIHDVGKVQFDFHLDSQFDNLDSTSKKFQETYRIWNQGFQLKFTPYLRNLVTLLLQNQISDLGLMIIIFQMTVVNSPTMLN